MRELDEVFEKYLLKSNVTGADGKITRRRLTSGAIVDVDQVITERLPALIKNILLAKGIDVEKYKIYGSVGQINWTLAYIPWVAILRRDITTSTERGYYVVLLFSQDMKDCYLSLNQGFTQFREQFGDRVGSRSISQTAGLAAKTFTAAPGLIEGRIDLSAKSALGRGYESGNIIARRYYATDGISRDEFGDNVIQLMSFYDQVFDKLGPNLLLHLNPLLTSDYQEAANELANSNVAALPTGSIPRPRKAARNGRASYMRDPKMAAIAIKASGYKCEIDDTHSTFISRRTKLPYVEAHHLLPMQYQQEFKFSLDVPENIVALCPDCHRKFHHARFGEFKKPLIELVSIREKGLQSRELSFELDWLKKIYKEEVEED
ncbi:MAG: DUF3578 domain-containing protein [Xanthobacteraceae bacterium]